LWGIVVVVGGVRGPLIGHFHEGIGDIHLGTGARRDETVAVDLFR